MFFSLGRLELEEAEEQQQQEMRGRPGAVLAVPDFVEGVVAVPLIISSVKLSLFGNMGLKHSGTLPQSNAEWHCLCGLLRGMVWEGAV